MHFFNQIKKYSLERHLRDNFGADLDLNVSVVFMLLWKAKHKQHCTVSCESRYVQSRFIVVQFGGNLCFERQHVKVSHKYLCLFCRNCQWGRVKFLFPFWHPLTSNIPVRDRAKLPLPHCTKVNYIFPSCSLWDYNYNAGYGNYLHVCLSVLWMWPLR